MHSFYEVITFYWPQQGDQATMAASSITHVMAAVENRMPVALAIITMFISLLYYHYRSRSKAKANANANVKILGDDVVASGLSRTSSDASTLYEETETLSQFHTSTSQVINAVKSIMQLDSNQWNTLQALVATSYLQHQLRAGEALQKSLQSKIHEVKDDLTDKLESTRSVLDKVAEEYNDEKRTNEELRDQLERKSLYIADLANELLSAKGFTRKLSQETTQSELDQTKTELLVLKQSITSLQAENESLKTANTDLTVSRDEFLQQLNNQSSDSKIKSLEEELKVIALENESMVKEAARLLGQLQNVEEEKSRLGINFDETRRALDENVKALGQTRDELGGIRLERDTIIATLTTIQTTLGELSTTYEETLKELNLTKDKYDLAVSEIDSLTLENEALIFTKGRNAELNAEVETLQSSNSKMKKDLEELQSNVTALKSELETVRSDHHKVKHSHDHHEKEATLWKEKYESEALEHSNTQTKCSQLENSHDNIKEKHEATKADFKEAEKELHQLRLAQNHLQFGHDSLTDEHTRLRSSYTLLQNDYEAMTKELSETRDLLTEQSNLTDAAQSLLNNMTSNVVPTLNNNISSSTQKVAALEALVASQKDEFEAAMSRASATHVDEVSSLSKHIDRLQSEIDIFRSELVHSRDDLSEKVDELNHAKHVNESLKHDIIEIKKERDIAELKYQDTLIEETEIRKKAQAEVVTLMAKNFELYHQLTKLQADVANIGGSVDYEHDDSVLIKGGESIEAAKATEPAFTGLVGEHTDKTIIEGGEGSEEAAQTEEPAATETGEHNDNYIIEGGVGTEESKAEESATTGLAGEGGGEVVKAEEPVTVATDRVGDGTHGRVAISEGTNDGETPVHAAPAAEPIESSEERTHGAKTTPSTSIASEGNLGGTATSDDHKQG